jgi:hypothetical protein
MASSYANRSCLKVGFDGILLIAINAGAVAVLAF